MTRKLMLASAIATALAGHPALALELGALRADSALNQPFQGEIELADIRADELDALRVSIAPPEDFEKLGIERYYYLTQLSFTPEATADGRVRLRVTSRDPMREPYLDFLIEAVWPTGRLVKGYTVLLDPPSLTERRAPNVRTARAGAVAGDRDSGQTRTVEGSGTYLPAPGDGFPLYIGPVGGGEGLWSLARRHATGGATDAQTALALYRCNQGAFVRGDINRLIAGKTLVIPSRAELFALDAEEARREFNAALRGRSPQRAPLTDVRPETLSRLRLVGATPGATVPAPSGSQTESAAAPMPGAAIPSSDVLLAIETSESARQEATELRNRIQELEAQLAEMQALLQQRDAAPVQAVPDTQVSVIPDDAAIAVPEPDSGVEPTPIPIPDPMAGATPVPGVLGDSDAATGPVSDAVPTETPLPITDEPDETPQSMPLADAIPDEAGEPESEPVSESASESEPTTAEEPAIGLVPVPTPLPIGAEVPVEPQSQGEDAGSTESPDAIESEPPTESPVPAESDTPDVSAQPETKPVATPAPESETAPVVVASDPAPEFESPSTWHSLLLPLAGLAGVTALGILLFSLMTARRRRLEQAGSEDDAAHDSDLVLDPADTAAAESGAQSSPTPAPASMHSRQSADALSLTKTGSASPSESSQRAFGRSTTASAAADLDDDDGDSSEPALSGLTDFDVETDEADVLSEVDIYMAYGRHREACDLLNKEIRRYPQRLDIRYKLAEAFAASGDAEALRNVLDEIRAAGGDTKEPAQWEQLQQQLSELSTNTSTTSTTPVLNAASVAAAAGAGLGLAAASKASESVALPDLASSGVSKPKTEEDLLLNLEDSESHEFDAPDSQPLDDSLKLELDSVPETPAVEEIAQAIEEDIESILPLSEGLHLDLGSLDEATPPAATPTSGAVADDLALDLDSGIPLLDDSLGSTSAEGAAPSAKGEPERPLDAPIPLDDPLEAFDKSEDALESGLSPEQESVPTDLLSSQWQIDSGIWDETATKLDLARAYVEMDDKEAAREILEEVIAEGREEQRGEARAMLERLGG